MERNHTRKLKKTSVTAGSAAVNQALAALGFGAPFKEKQMKMGVDLSREHLGWFSRIPPAC